MWRNWSGDEVYTVIWGGGCSKDIIHCNCLKLLHLFSSSLQNPLLVLNFLLFFVQQSKWINYHSLCSCSQWEAHYSCSQENFSFHHLLIAPLMSVGRFLSHVPLLRVLLTRTIQIVDWNWYTRSKARKGKGQPGDFNVRSQVHITGSE